METREVKHDLRRKSHGGRSTASVGSPGVSFVLREEKQRRKKRIWVIFLNTPLSLNVCSCQAIKAWNIQLVKLAHSHWLSWASRQRQPNQESQMSNIFDIYELSLGMLLLQEIRRSNSKRSGAVKHLSWVLDKKSFCDNPRIRLIPQSLRGANWAPNQA